MLNLGYIGNGKSTNRYHIPFVLERKDTFRIKTIYERDAKRRAWETMDGVKYTSDLCEVLDDEDIDVIVVCTSQDSHFDYAKMALLHDKHVLVEKPFMMNYQQAKDIFELAHRVGKHIECFQNRRYDSDFLTVKKVIESGVLGDIYEIEMNYDYNRSQTPYQNAYSHYDGFLYGHGCHTLDQAISYLGIPNRVVYQVKCLCGKDHMNDYFDLDLFYKDAMKVSIRSSFFRIKSRPSFVVYGKSGMFMKETMDQQERDLKKFYLPNHEDFGLDTLEEYGTITYDDHGEIKEEKVKSVRGDYGRVYDALYDTIVYHNNRVVKEEETLCVMRLLERGMEACEGTSILVEEIV